MTEVCDISPGTNMKAKFTGYVYTVRSIGEDRIVSEGPNGCISVDKEEAHKDIAAGRLIVLN
jgi:hypothetical protein